MNNIIFRYFFFVIVFYLSNASICLAGERMLFDSNWKFYLGDNPGLLKPDFDDSSLTKVDLPHDWSISGPINVKNITGSSGGYFPAGVGWYRKSFTLPDNIRNKNIFLHFEGVYMRSEVWINGQKLAYQASGYIPFSVDITKSVKWGRQNIVAVRVDNSKQFNSRWYSGSGIYRHVWLEYQHPIHVEPNSVFVQPRNISNQQATLQIHCKARNANNSDQSPVIIQTRIFRLDESGKSTGNSVAESNPVVIKFVKMEQIDDLISTHDSEVILDSPALWSPDQPNRYVAITELRHDGNLIDRVQTPFGIRTIDVSAEKGFLLNGKRVILYGGSVHHDHGALGAASFDRAEERKVQSLKEAGFNAVRTSHNPPSSAFLEACDRLGLMVMDEAFDCWEQGKNHQDYHRDFKDSWQKDLGAMVLRDRNRPSVVMWSIGNEIPDFGSAQGLRNGSMLIDYIKQLDPTRPITAAVFWYPGIGGDNRWEWKEADSLMGLLDIVGYNYQIYRYDEDHRRLPNRVIVSTESYTRDYFACWAASTDKPYVIGDFVWTAMDYLGESGIGRVFNPDEKIIYHGDQRQFPYHGAECGDIDLTGFRKPISHIRNVTWDRGEKLYTSITEPTPDGRPLQTAEWGIIPTRSSWTWPGYEGKTLEVQVFSRYDSVRLYLNDKLIGEKPTSKNEQFKALFQVPYSPGELKTVGIKDGKVIETSVMQTAGDVRALRLTVDRTEIAADGADLAFVTVESLDDRGNFQPNGDQEVRFEITGNATIAGVASGDYSKPIPYQAKNRPLFHGRAQVILRSTNLPGKIKLIAQADKLITAQIEITSIQPISEANMEDLDKQKTLQPASEIRSPDGRKYLSQPLVSSIYTADPSAHVFDGKLYIYPSHDVEVPPLPDIEPFKGAEGNGFAMHDYIVLSMDHVGGDVTIHPVALDLKDVPWAARQLWAPDCAFKNGMYYLYFPAKDKKGAFRIGVATSKQPAGPFTAEPEPIKGSYSIDPAVFIDDDGQSYLYFGGCSGGQLDKFSMDGEYHPNWNHVIKDKSQMPRVARLSDNMLDLAEISREVLIVDESGKPIQHGDDERSFFEACWMHKYNGKYYLSYSTGGTHFIAYGMSDSPYGPFVHKGNILLPVQGWTTHHSVVKHQEKWWLFYADCQLSNSSILRNTKVTELHYNPDGTIQSIDPFLKE